MKKKAMLSQPMGGRTEQEIIATRNRAVAELERRGYEVVNTYFHGAFESNMNTINKPLYCLGKSILCMAVCDTVYFCHGWQNARGCRIEHDAAVAYGLEVIEE